MSKTMITATKRVAVHPGRLLSRVMAKSGITQAKLAKHIGVTQPYISDICRGRIGISAEMAKKLAKAFNQAPEFWMNAQSAWELSQAPEAGNIKPLAAQGASARSGVRGTAGAAPVADQL